MPINAIIWLTQLLLTSITHHSIYESRKQSVTYYGIYSWDQCLVEWILFSLLISSYTSTKYIYTHIYKYVYAYTYTHIYLFHQGETTRFSMSPDDV